MRLNRLTPGVVAMAAMLLAAGCDDGTESAGGGNVTGGLPPFELAFSAPAVEGVDETVSLDAYRGKVVLVDLFGTWCPPCRASAPVLVSLYHRYHGSGFTIIGLAYEKAPTPEDRADAVRRFADQFSIPYPLALGPESVWDQLPGAARRDVYPTLVLVGRDGVGRNVFQGFDADKEPAQLTRRIEQLLAEPAPAH